MAVPKGKKPPADEPEDKGPEAPDDSQFDQSAKGEAAGLGGAPGEGANEEAENKPLIGPLPEEKAAVQPAPEVTADDPVQSGVLYACDLGRVSMMSANRTECEKAEHHPGCAVELNGKPATLDDLRREDRVQFFGLPVKKIVASR